MQHLRFCLFITRFQCFINSIFVICASIVVFILRISENIEAPTGVFFLVAVSLLLFFGDENTRKDWKDASKIFKRYSVEEMLTHSHPDVRQYGQVLAGTYKESLLDFVPPFMRRERVRKERLRESLETLQET